MKIVRIENYRTDENCYMLINNGQAVVIDPGSSAEVIIERAGSEGAEIKYILLTHCHYDHIEGVPELREKTGAALALTDICAKNAADKNVNMTEAGIGRAVEITEPEIILKSEAELCGINIKVLRTPGHTSCGCCFLAENHLFSGDTLFLRSIGRWDLPTGDEETLKKSIKEVLYSLDDDIDVHPGHGADTKIGYEKKYNFYCKG